MIKVAILSLLVIVTGCASNKGITELKQFQGNKRDQILILKDSATRGSVLPVLETWFQDNGYNAIVIASLKEANPDDHILSYRAWWGWDLATYMRKVEMRLKTKGETLGSLDFDALQYGGFGKFGDAEQRLIILLDVLFGKITYEKANKLLGES